MNATTATITETLYYYAEVNGGVFVEMSNLFSYTSVPLVDDPVDVTTCDSYVLPPVTNANYNTIQMEGTTLNAGDVISVASPNFQEPTMSLILWRTTSFRNLY